jgi:hypothetical protein
MTGASFFVPGSVVRAAVDIGGFKQFEVAPLGKAAQPAESTGGFVLIVVALDDQRRMPARRRSSRPAIAWFIA